MGRVKSGQVSIEFLLIIGFAMLLSLPLIFIFFKQSESLNSEISSSQIDKAANEVRDAADEVYYLGSPSKKSLTLYLPEGVQNVTIADNRIIFSVSSPSGHYEIVKWSSANFSSDSNISAHNGIHQISVEARDYDVLITDN